MTRPKRRRTAKYKRVSHKEQALHGFSLKAQDEALDAYAKEHNLEIVKDYTDAGYTASNTKRPALQQLLTDIKAGKIDLVIFTKLDRWFRSVSDYYEIQRILDYYGVAWRTVQEDYTTETGDGRFKVNIMLSVAQQELDRTSERIKNVFESKVRNKEPITGLQAFGYTIGEVDGHKRVIKDKEVEHIVDDMFNHFLTYQSVNKTFTYINDKYDLNFVYNTYKAMLVNEYYTGNYRGVEEYCEPYITKDQYEKICSIFDNHQQVKQNVNTYLFPSLVYCPKCGKRCKGMASISGGRKKNKLFYYRCSYAYHRLCGRSKLTREDVIENYLLENVIDELKKYIVTIEVEETKAVTPQKSKKAKYQEELRRLNRMYQAGSKTDEEFDEEFARLKGKIAECDGVVAEKKDIEKLKEFLDSDFQSIYQALTKVEKQALWRSIIKKIVVHDNLTIDVEFI